MEISMGCYQYADIMDVVPMIKGYLPKFVSVMCSICRKLCESIKCTSSRDLCHNEAP